MKKEKHQLTAEEKAAKKKKAKKRRGTVTNIILVLFLLIGIAVVSYPTVSDWWNSMHMSRAVSNYIEAIENMTDDELVEALDAAHAYNERLAHVGMHFNLTEEELAEYNSLLDVTGTGIMGYIQIPAINVNLPIYHGTEESVLQIAVGHLEGTSLPVGGPGTHTALSGHRGLPSARLFTDLDKLTEGDVFTVNVLNETITYMIDQIRIVLPAEVQELSILEGEDHCTLITCTPYGVNTHRMLVRGTRIENLMEGEEVINVPADAVKYSTYVVILAVGIPLMFIVQVITLIYFSKKKPRRSDAELLDEFKKM